MRIKLRIKKDTRPAFSLVELITVLGVMTFAVAIFVPLLIDARDQVRLAQCADNLRRMGQAWNAHEQSLGYYPSSGWGWRWTGDPDRGFGQNQPGGWAYDVVRFTEYSNDVSRGAGQADLQKSQQMVNAHQIPIPFFNCPQRRAANSYPLVRNGDLANNLRECRAQSCSVTRLDYQANSGNIAVGEAGGPTGTRATSEIPTATVRNWNGVTSQISQLRLVQVEDGLSKTMCMAEKYLDPNHYTDGNSSADDNSAFNGVDRDSIGYTASASRTEEPFPIPSFQPRRDRRGLGLNWTFGSAHPSVFNSLSLDGSVRNISYNVDYFAFFLLGGRDDGPQASEGNP